MKSPSNKKQLLNDVLSESGPDGFREALLDETLRLARLRRRTRQLWRVSPVLLVGALGWYLFPTHPAAEKTEHLFVEIVATKPFDPAAVVCTQTMAMKLMVSSTPSVYVVHTRPSGEGFRLIGDDELMALAAPRPTVLMRLGPDSQTLIFTDGKDVTDLRPN
jgi:hypothetical protein